MWDKTCASDNTRASPLIEGHSLAYVKSIGKKREIIQQGTETEGVANPWSVIGPGT